MHRSLAGLLVILMTSTAFGVVPVTDTVYVVGISGMT